MADLDDFEMIDEIGTLDDPVFEDIDYNGMIEIRTPTTPDVVLPFLIPQPLVEETLQIVEQPTSKSIVNTPEPEQQKQTTPVQTTVPITTFIPIKPTSIQTPPAPRIFAPVPPLPKAPPPRRYGNAAIIPHNSDTSLDIDTIINKSRQTQKAALQLSIQQQQDIQTVLEQRRQLLNKNKL
jgi:hypothetical protein